MIAACYDLTLYCDGAGCATGRNRQPHQWTGEKGSTCRAEARRAGWKLNWDEGTAYCPKCRARSTSGGGA